MNEIDAIRDWYSCSACAYCYVEENRFPCDGCVMNEGKDDNWVLDEKWLMGNIDSVNRTLDSRYPDVDRIDLNIAPKQDAVNHPTHYNSGKMECIDAIDELTSHYKEQPFVAYCLGNVCKYTWRAPLKNGKEDLEKARWYLDKAIANYQD